MTAPRLAFYGDDFTGSTDALEVMSFAGLKSVLFTRVPSADEARRFADYEVVGIAGTARARSPDWMDRHLPEIFHSLVGTGASIVQYKVCSTFDSAPEIGSIGRAIEIGRRIVGSAYVPIVVGAPALGRWQVFGNLFAADGTGRYRIDRHPTMSRHPVTPMLEGDLARHLSLQTEDDVSLLDVVDIRADDWADRADAARRSGAIVFLDVADAKDLPRVGAIVDHPQGGPVFTASSSGLNYALAAHWRQQGNLPEEATSDGSQGPDGPVLILSGSCSPATARQIEAAERSGIRSVRIDTLLLAADASRGKEEARVLDAVVAILEDGDPALVYAARSYADEAVAALRRRFADDPVGFERAQDEIGRSLGRIANVAVSRGATRRILVAGGDTSGRIVETLPGFALEVVASVARGAPACRLVSDDPSFDGIHLILKGGQIGGDDLFVEVASDPSSANRREALEAS